MVFAQKHTYFLIEVTMCGWEILVAIVTLENMSH